MYSIWWGQFRNTPGYNLVRTDHSSRSERGGVCIYYKNSLKLRVLNIHYLQEIKNIEIIYLEKLSNVISLHRSPSEYWKVIKEDK